MTKSTIYYWHDWINRAEFQGDPIVIAKISQILQNEPGVKIGRMVNHPIYKTRLNDTDRIYWTTKMVDGRPYMVMLGKIINHDYDLNIFKKGTLDKFLKRNDARLFTEARDLANQNQTRTLNTETSESTRSLYYQQQFITLTQDQLNLRNTSSACVAISGPTGSGKSCVLFDALRNMRDLRGKTCDKPLLYVAQSSRLPKELKKMWGVGAELNQDNSDVLFMSYDELITYLNPECLARHRVGEHDCLTWLDQHIRQQKHTTNNSLTWLINALHQNKNMLKTVYEEFRVISLYASTTRDLDSEDHYFTKNTYLNLGVKQSLFDKNFRDFLFDLYLSYIRSLSKDQWDPAFHDVTHRAQFYGIVVDEALDLSLLQLISLFTLTTDSKIYYAMDSHQRQHDRRSHRPLLLDILRRLYPDVLHAQLSGSYRCPNEMIRVSNGLIQLKLDLAGKASDCFEDRIISVSADPEKETGTFFFVEPSTRDSLTLMLVPESAPALPQPTSKKPMLVQWQDQYFSYGKINALNWGFTPLNSQVMQNALSELNLDLSKQREIHYAPDYQKIYQHIQQQGGHKPSTSDDAVLHDLFPSTNCVVLTRKEHLAEAGRLYPTPLILTPNDIKGLEYDDVICYRLFDDHEKMGSEINKQWGKLVQGAHHEHNDQFDLFLNDIIIAITRARKRVFFVQSNTHHVQHILPKLQTCLMHQRDLLTNILQQKTDKPTEQEWLDHAAMLLKNGNEPIAQSIFEHELGKTTGEFITFKASQTPMLEHDIVSVAVSPSSSKKPKSAKKQNTFKPIHLESTLISASPSLSSPEMPVVTLKNKGTEPQFSPSSVINTTPTHNPPPKRTLHDSIEFLFKNFTIENLTRWFNSPNGISYLVRIVDTDHCLLECLLSCQERAQLFCDFLKNAELSDENSELIVKIAELTYPPNDSSVIHIAVQVDCAELIDLFSARGMYLEYGNKHRETPLYIAFKKRYHSTINALINADAELFLNGTMAGDNDPIGSFFTAVDFDVIDVIHHFNVAILNDSITTLQDNVLFPIHGATPLITAVQLNDLSRVFDMLTKENNDDVNQFIEKSGATALLIAVQLGYFSMVELLLDHYASVNQPMNNGVTALILAAQFGYLDIVCLLLQHGARVNWQTDDACSALMCAANFGHHEIISTLLRYDANINLINEQNYSAIQIAECHHHAKAEQLLKKEYLFSQLTDKFCKRSPIDLPNINAFFDYLDNGTVTILLGRIGHDLQNGGTLFSYYLNHAGWKSLFYCFLNSTEQGKSIFINICLTALRPNGYTALHLAAMDGHSDFIDFAYEYNVFVDSRNKRGDTPLFTAIKFRQFKTAQALIKAKAVVDLTNNNQSTPLSLAVLLNDFKSACLLLKFGATNTIYWIDQQGESCLTLLAKQGVEGMPIATILLQKNSTGINQLHKKTGESPLYIAARNGCAELVQLFLFHGAIIDLPTKDGLTPLMIAVQHGHASVVEHLLNAGADVSKTDRGITILSLTQNTSNTAVKDLVVRAMTNHPKLNAHQPTSRPSPLVTWGFHAPSIVRSKEDNHRPTFIG